MKTMTTILVLLLAVVARGGAADAQSAFAAGDYAKAVPLAEQQLAQEPPSAEGFYNLGLAAEKSGDAIKAALNFQRALLLDPTLSPARNELARLTSANHAAPTPHDWTRDVNAVVHPDALIVTGTVLGWIGAFGLLFAANVRRRRALVNLLAVTALVAGGAAFFAGWMTDGRLASARPAMVTARDGADVLTAPASNSDVLVALPAGTAVGVLSPQGAWAYVDLSSGVKGWVQSDRLTPIVPGEKF